jgi:hypothetical protein
MEIAIGNVQATADLQFHSEGCSAGKADQQQSNVMMSQHDCVTITASPESSIRRPGLFSGFGLNNPCLYQKLGVLDEFSPISNRVGTSIDTGRLINYESDRVLLSCVTTNACSSVIGCRDNIFNMYLKVPGQA